MSNSSYPLQVRTAPRSNFLSAPPVLRRVLENSPEPALGDVPIMPALRSVPKCRHRVCLRRPRPAASLRILAGSDSSAWRRWLDLLDVRGSWLVWDGGIPRLPGRRPRPAASLRSLRAALENASRFLSSAPLRARIPPLAHKKAPWAVMGLGRSVLMAGTEGFEPPTAGTKNRSSTVELRPNVWCCPKATRLVYLICEGIANAVE